MSARRGLVFMTDPHLTARQLATAWRRYQESFNEPDLEFGASGGATVVRFHRKHSRLSAIEGIRVPLRIAVRRAFPGVRVLWAEGTSRGDPAKGT